MYLPANSNAAHLPVNIPLIVPDAPFAKVQAPTRQSASDR